MSETATKPKKAAKRTKKTTTDTNTEKPKRSYVSDEDFVRAWESSNSVTEVVEKLGYTTVNTASHRAKRLRDRGVNLKKFDRRKKEINVDGLNNLIETLNGD